jgi:DNA-directed RNA polymerase specialized sigma24 family protein
LGARAVSTPELAEMCREESERYRRQRPDDRGHCYELFRRAIVERDERAWDSLYVQYRRLVARWVDGPPDRVDERVNGTWLRFWKAIDPSTFPRKFAATGKIIKFLHTCAHSERIDERRREEKQQRLADLQDVTAETKDTTAAPAMDNVLLNELFTHVEKQLRDEQERLVIHLSFRVGLAPRQIARECPGAFADVAEVRRVKERVMLRLSTDPRLQGWWSPPNSPRQKYLNDVH